MVNICIYNYINNDGELLCIQVVGEKKKLKEREQNILIKGSEEKFLVL